MSVGENSIDLIAWDYLSYPWGPSCPGYAGGDSVTFDQEKSVACGDSCNTIVMSGPNHIGTHIDAPFHFDRNGRTIDDYQPSEFIFNNVGILWLSGDWFGKLVDETVFENFRTLDKDIEILLIRTGCGTMRGKEQYWRHGAGLAPGLAEFLRRQFPRLRCVGLDCISISSFAHRDLGREAHREFLNKNPPFLLIEDMKLESLYGKKVAKVIALPLRLEKGDGAPCTVIAETV